MQHKDFISPSNRNSKQVTPNTSYLPLPHHRQDPYVKDPIVSEKSDQEFFGTLKKFRPICYKGIGTPIFMMNKDWYYNLPCILLMNVLIILVIILYITNSSKSVSKYRQPQNPVLYIILNIGVLILTNLFYFLTQFMNPGIQNISSLDEEQYEENQGKFYCIRCNGYRTGEMEHCADCDACINKMDHHCGFFNKCIGGYQTYAFYGFLSSIFIGFLCLLVTLTSSVWI